MNKPIFIGLIPLLLSLYQANAQNFKGGLLAGIAATQVDGDTYGGYNKAGPIAGIWVERNFLPDWFFRISFRYIQKGSYAKDRSSDSPDFYRMRLNYFDLPVVAGYRFVNGFNAVLGLSAGYLSKATEENSLGPFPPEEVSAFNKFEIAGIAGMEYNYSAKWRFGLNITYSIFPVRPYRDNISYRLNKGQYNRVLEFVAIYRIQ
ncbi:porin family protein [Tenuifilum osseticum]|uniref:porin family protein n=1 Tax=Tenuifilum osseticum TaxID=3374723 RepID=UPI0034E49E46